MLDAGRNITNSARLRILTVTFVILSMFPLPTQAAVPTDKTFDVTGIVDCGRASG